MEQANAHLHRGFIARLSMIEHAAVNLDVELSKATGPLDAYLAVELSLLLNSFYLHLAGSLDNLAWALGFQYNLKPGLNEKNRKDQIFIGLFNQKFLEALNEKDKVVLTNLLQDYKNWNQDLKTFRDPGAHRIPLQVPPSFYSENDVTVAKKLDAKAAEHYSKGNIDKGNESMHKMTKLGIMYPTFIVEIPDVRIYDLGPKVTKDFSTWYKIAASVFEHGFGLGKL
jgi:hypothetical protein